MEYDDNDDYCYTYPTAGDGEEVQWGLMAIHGLISQEFAERLTAFDALPVTKVDVLTVDYSCVRRLRFTRMMSSVDRTLGDLPAIPARGYLKLAKALTSCGVGVTETYSFRNPADVAALTKPAAPFEH